MAHTHRVCRPQGITTWVDDTGVDIQGFTSKEVASRTLHTFKTPRPPLRRACMSVALTSVLRKAVSWLVMLKLVRF